MNQKDYQKDPDWEYHEYICDVTLHPNDWVATNGDCDKATDKIIVGKIGRITSDRFYIWQNEFYGKGQDNMTDPDFRFSWSINVDNTTAWIAIRKDKIPENKFYDPNET